MVFGGQSAQLLERAQRQFWNLGAGIMHPSQSDAVGPLGQAHLGSRGDVYILGAGSIVLDRVP